MKTLAVRLDDDLHARVTLVAKLSSTTVTDLIRTAVERHLEQTAKDPEISAKAKDLTAQIDQDAELQRQAVSALFGSSGPRSGAGKNSRGRSGDGPG